MKSERIAEMGNSYVLSMVPKHGGSKMTMSINSNINHVSGGRLSIKDFTFVVNEIKRLSDQDGKDYNDGDVYIVRVGNVDRQWTLKDRSKLNCCESTALLAEYYLGFLWKGKQD